MNGLRLGWVEDAGERRAVYLPETERDSHLYVIGSTGVGKSKALASWAVNDLKDGYAFGVIDPHGDLIADILAHAVAFPLLRLVEFGSAEMVTMNPLEPVEGIDPFTQTLELVDVFRKVWGLSDESAPRLLEILRNSVWTLIEAGGTLLELEVLLTDRDYRARALHSVTNEGVARFWRDRFERWPAREQALYVESTLNKVSAFTADPRLRLMLGARESSLDLREVMDRGEILLVDLSKGVLRTNTELIGALFLSRLQMAAISRLAERPERRSPWTLYVDEFQNYATDSFAELLSEARKMGLRLVLAHQSLAQLPPQLAAIVLGNARSLVAFRSDRVEAELLARYIGDVDPLAVKWSDRDRIYFSSIEEQWEGQVSELAALPVREAILRTKGQEPRRFHIFEFASDPRASEGNRALLREYGLGAGWLRPVAELDEELAVRAVATAPTGDEPEHFWESPRGSD